MECFDPHLLLEIVKDDQSLSTKVKKFTNLENKNADAYKSYSLRKDIISKIQKSQGTQEEEEKFRKLALYEYSIGAYHEAAEKLFFLSASRFAWIKEEALWGKLSCEILLKNYKSAEKVFRELEIEIENIKDQEVGLRSRVYLAHWALFFEFGQFQLDLFFKPAYMNSIQMAAPWLLKYVVVVVLLCGKKYINELTKILSSESQTHNSIVQFFEAIYCRSLDLKLASSKLKELVKDLENDYFLKKVVIPFMNSCQRIVFEVLVKTHSSVGFEKLGSMMILKSQDVSSWVIEYQKDHKSILLDDKLVIALFCLTLETSINDTSEKTDH